MDSINSPSEKSSKYPEYLILQQDHWEQMQQHVKNNPHEEVCGLLAGYRFPMEYVAKTVIPITNELHSPYRYRMDPKEQVKAFLTIEDRNMQLVAIYHSHPFGPAFPSATDLLEAYYPDAVQIIWSYQEFRWDSKGFIIHSNSIREITIRITSNTANTDD